MNIRIIEHESASEFLDSCQHWLSKYELINHGVLSLASILSPDNPIYQPPFLFGHVSIDGRIAGCWIHAEPDGLVLSDCEDNIVPDLFNHLRSRISIPSRIFGPREPALQLAKLFADFVRSSYRIHSSWRIHRLDRIAQGKSSVNGHIEIGEIKSGDLVRRWGKKYNEERPANLDIEQFLSKKLIDRNLYFWVDGTPKCLATISGLNCSGPRISAVYTPPTFRTRGYATELVRSLSKMYLESGSAYVTLNTLAGDSVERIYKRLGYETIGEKVSVIFQDE